MKHDLYTYYKAKITFLFGGTNLVDVAPVRLLSTPDFLSEHRRESEALLPECPNARRPS